MAGGGGGVDVPCASKNVTRATATPVKTGRACVLRSCWYRLAVRRWMVRASGLVPRDHDDLVDVDVRRAGDGEGHAVGDVVAVRGRRPPRTPWRPALHRPGSARRRTRSRTMPGSISVTADGPAEQLHAQHLREGAHAELGGVVAGAARVGLDAGDRAHHDDVAVAAGLQRRSSALRHRARCRGRSSSNIHCQSSRRTSRWHRARARRRRCSRARGTRRSLRRTRPPTRRPRRRGPSPVAPVRFATSSKPIDPPRADDHVESPFASCRGGAPAPMPLLAPVTTATPRCKAPTYRTSLFSRLRLCCRPAVVPLRSASRRRPAARLPRLVERLDLVLDRRDRLDLAGRLWERNALRTTMPTESASRGHWYRWTQSRNLVSGSLQRLPSHQKKTSRPMMPSTLSVQKVRGRMPGRSGEEADRVVGHDRDERVAVARELALDPSQLLRRTLPRLGLEPLHRGLAVPASEEEEQRIRDRAAGRSRPRRTAPRRCPQRRRAGGGDCGRRARSEAPDGG